MNKTNILDRQFLYRLVRGQRLLKAGLVAVLAIVSSLTALANTAVEPVPPRDDRLQQHEQFVAQAAEGGIKVLFIGDSITDSWRTRGETVWEREYSLLQAANFGISADRTQNVLWRLQHGEAEGIQPQVVVLLIGTNNTGFEQDGVTPRNSVPEISAGVAAVVTELQGSFPDAAILLLGIFPRGERDDLQRAQVKAVNACIATLHDGEQVFFLDLGNHFLDDAGNIPRELMADLLHPSTAGYAVWAEAMRAPLQALLTGADTVETLIPEPQGAADHDCMGPDPGTR